MNKHDIIISNGHILLPILLPLLDIFPVAHLIDVSEDPHHPHFPVRLDGADELERRHLKSKLGIDQQQGLQKGYYDAEYLFCRECNCSAKDDCVYF